MSYPANALAKTAGLVTTRPLRAGLRITGQRRALSRIDITRINRMSSRGGAFRQQMSISKMEMSFSDYL